MRNTLGPLATIRRRLSSERGASLVSYAIITTLVAILAVGSATLMGVSIRSLFSTNTATLEAGQQVALKEEATTPPLSPITSAPLSEGTASTPVAPEDGDPEPSPPAPPVAPEQPIVEAPTALEPWPSMAFPDTLLAYDDPQLILSIPHEVSTRTLQATEVVLTADSQAAEPRLIEVENLGGQTPDTTTVAIQTRAPAPGSTTTIQIQAGSHTSTWRVTRAPAIVADPPHTPAPPAQPEPNTPSTTAPPDTPPAQVPSTHVGTLLIPWTSGQQSAQSPYISLGAGPFDFTVTATQGPAVATTTTQGKPGTTGTLAWGTALEASVPGYGEATTVTLTLPGRAYTWTLGKEALPRVQPFDFGTLVLDWNDSRTRVSSPYLDIQGLEFIPRPFTLSGSGQPRLASNVTSGDPAQSGMVANGTQIEADSPAPGEEQVIHLSIGEARGQWVVKRAPIPAPTNRFALTASNDKNWAQITFRELNIPQRPYAFSLSGTGDTQPRSKGDQSGYTDAWGMNISYKAPPKGEIATITLIIDGQRVQWSTHGF